MEKGWKLGGKMLQGRVRKIGVGRSGKKGKREWEGAGKKEVRWCKNVWEGKEGKK